MRKPFLKIGVRNAFLRSLSTLKDCGKAPSFGLLEALEILTLIVGVLVVMRHLVR